LTYPSPEVFYPPIRDCAPISVGAPPNSL